MKINIDALIITLPFERPYPLSAPAKLKSIAEQNGFKVKCIDWNIKLYSIFKKLHNEIINTKISRRDEQKKVKTYWIDKFKPEIIKFIKEIKIYKSKWLAFSSFSHQEYITIEILKLVRKTIQSKIIIGGHSIHFSDNNNNSLDINKKLGCILKENNLIDYYIEGEGEYSFINILNGNIDYNGINNNNYSRIENLNLLPEPDYSDYNFSKYKKDFYLPVEYSRGCKNCCSFCYRIYKKPIRFSNDKIIKHMTNINKKYNINNFFFTDENFPFYKPDVKQLLIELSKYNFKWRTGTECFIIQKFDIEFFELLKSSGCERLLIGVESGSEKVRKDMGKHFTNNDIKYSIKQCSKNKIQVIILLMIGYITETEYEFQKTLDLLHQLKKYQKYIHVVLGQPCYILPNTKLSKFADKNNIDYSNNKEWIYKDNNINIRYRRWLKTKLFCEKNNFSYEKG